MDIRVELVALAIRKLANHTDLVRRPDSLETFINQILGLKSYDRRLAEDVIAEVKRTSEAVKRANTRRKFKKIVQMY